MLVENCPNPPRTIVFDSGCQASPKRGARRRYWFGYCPVGGNAGFLTGCGYTWKFRSESATHYRLRLRLPSKSEARREAQVLVRILPGGRERRISYRLRVHLEVPI